MPRPPYQPPMSAHVRQMPHYRNLSLPNPEAESTYICSPVCAHPRHTNSPGNPTAQEYEETYSLRPTASIRPHHPAAYTQA